MTRSGPLVGLRVLELGHFVAAPFAARLLADLGADVIKVEPPGGDPVRQWGKLVDGNAPWWSLHGRNKRSVVVDLKHKDARALVLDLVKESDVVVENFRPGQLGKLGLGDEALRAARSDVVIAHLSGYGQNGPYRDRPAFGVIGEAMGGLRHLSNHAPGTTDLPPVRVGVSIGDSIAGLYTAFGIMVSLYTRPKSEQRFVVDVALTESILSMMEGMLPEYAALGTIRQPVGSRIATAAPSNAYPTADGAWLLVAANSDPLFARLCRLIGRPELASDSRFTGNAQRVRNDVALDEIISAWTRERTAAELERMLTEADIPNTKVFTAADIASDAQYRERKMVRTVEDPRFGSMLHTGVVPHFPECPGDVAWPGPALGEHTDEVLREVLGYAADRVAALREGGVVSC